MSTHYILTGFPRAGSTMLYNMFRYSVTNCTFYEREMMATKVLNEKTTRMTKRPQDIFKCKELSESTKTQFILILRDPRSVLTSIHANSEGRYKCSWNYSLKTSTKGICGQTPGLKDYCEVLPQVPDPIIVYYENLVRDPNAEQIFLETQMPELNFERNFSDFYKVVPPEKLTHQMNGLRPPDPETIDKWKEHPKRIKDQVEKFPEILDVLIELGYAKDKEWILEL